MKKKGFHLSELVVFMLCAGVLMSVVVWTLSPGTQLVSQRNQKRSRDVQRIQRSIQAYYEHFGDFPEGISDRTSEICRRNEPWCGDMIDFSLLDDLGIYPDISPDPHVASRYGTGYFILKKGYTLTIIAAGAENGEIIESTSIYSQE